MRIYLDHNATTPLRPEVLEVMLRVLRDVPGNPSSTHAEGAAARGVVEEARAVVASLLGAEPREVVFTAGASEANNTVLATLRTGEATWTRLVTTRAEHPSVREPAQQLARAGVDVTWLGVDATGRVAFDELEAALMAGPALVSVIYANNETGVLQDIEAIAERVRERGGWLHVDATQALGKIDVARACAAAHWVSCSAHKLGGPKGCGALVVREGGRLSPLVHGGPQERRARGGTENVAGIAGFGAACALAAAEPGVERLGALRDRLWDGLVARVAQLRWNGLDDPAESSRDGLLPNTLNVEFRGAAGDVLLQALDLEGVAVSAGAACHSGSIEPSHVLVAMGRDASEARAALRFSLGHGNDAAQVDEAIARVAALVPRAREAASP